MLQPVVRRGLLGSATNALASSAPSGACCIGGALIGSLPSSHPTISPIVAPSPSPALSVQAAAAAAAAAAKAAGVRARARPWEALQHGQQPWRGMAVETSEPTPVPPPPPAPRNYVYPAVLALTAATVAYVMMTCVAFWHGLGWAALASLCVWGAD